MHEALSQMFTSYSIACSNNHSLHEDRLLVLHHFQFEHCAGGNNPCGAKAITRVSPNTETDFKKMFAWKAQKVLDSLEVGQQEKVGSTC